MWARTCELLGYTLGHLHFLPLLLPTPAEGQCIMGYLVVPSPHKSRFVANLRVERVHVPVVCSTCIRKDGTELYTSTQGCKYCETALVSLLIQLPFLSPFSRLFPTRPRISVAVATVCPSPLHRENRRTGCAPERAAGTRRHQVQRDLQLCKQQGRTY